MTFFGFAHEVSCGEADEPALVLVVSQALLINSMKAKRHEQSSLADSCKLFTGKGTDGSFKFKRE